MSRVTLTSVPDVSGTETRLSSREESKRVTDEDLEKGLAQASVTENDQTTGRVKHAGRYEGDQGESPGMQACLMCIGKTCKSCRTIISGW